MNRALIADIGGTNARFGIVDQDGIHDVHYLDCRKYGSLIDAAQAYLQQTGQTQPVDLGVFAVAAPVQDETITFTSIPTWKTTRAEVQSSLGLGKFELMNDFEAVALSVPAIDESLLIKVGDAPPTPERAKAVIGPGTGLGVASLIWSGNRYIAQAGEGGHVTMPAVNEREFEIFQQLRVKYHHISAERVVSGKGLENLYNAIRALDKKYELPDLTAPEISQKAMKRECDTCFEALDMMVAFLGRVTGNLALTLNTRGGVYVAGGITPKISNFILNSRFLEEFEAKGRMTDFMKKIPVYLINHDAIAMKGLEYHARLQLS